MAGATDAPSPIRDLIAGSGEARRAARERSWAQTPLGPVSEWPQSLRTAVSICLDSRFPMALWWGNQYTQLYNDGYIPALAGKHPRAMGQPAAECWHEIWDVCGPLADHVRLTGESTFSEDLLLLMMRSGYEEETYFTFAYSPIRDESDGVGGVLVTCVETTDRVVGARRMQVVRELGEAAAGAQTLVGACEGACAVFDRNPADVPFAALYVPDGAGAFSMAAHSKSMPAGIRLRERLRPGDATWPTTRAATERRAVAVDLSTLATGGQRQAVLVPLFSAGAATPAAFAILGANPRRPLDAEHLRFFELIGNQLINAIGNATLHEEEHRRAEALAELDRAKTAFFSNVSHELRTPLTLALAPIEDLLGRVPAGGEEGQLLELAHRNGRRLLKLVNALLEFSRMEAGRIEASYVETDLGRFTADISSGFRSAIEKAGMTFEIDCPQGVTACVDLDMWEKMVLNLISNAFKFTVAGSITVSVRAAGGCAILRVTDTGMGIAPEDQERIFDRFVRLGNAAGRTIEGTGIGLSLVREYARLHGGTVTVASTPDRGSEFTVAIPLGREHLPAGAVRPPDGAGAPRTSEGAVFVQEALSWVSAEPADLGQDDTVPAATTKALRASRQPTVLVADDNADMRDYLQRVLGANYRLLLAEDGLAALEMARREPIDLVVCDVMMPGLDGFALLAALRAGSDTADIPVVMVSARAGEEARVEGLRAGADDYIVKPFSARELVARVDAAIMLTAARREAAENLRASETRFRLWADHTPAMVWAADERGHCTFLSKSWYEFTGLEPPAGLGASGGALIHPDDRDAVRKALQSATRRRAPLRREYRLRSADGTFRWVVDTATPNIDEAGRFLGFIGSIIDLHERKVAEDALRESTRLKDQVIGLVSHEFRTPLTSIVGNIDLVRRRFEELDAAERASALADLASDAERLTQLVENMLTLARVDTKSQIEREPVLLQRVLPTVVARNEARDPARTYRLEISQDLPPVLASPSIVDQVLDNLVGNSRKYATAGTAIEVSARHGEDGAVLTVRDRGRVMSAAEVERFFEPFYRDAWASSTAGGSGLGLSVCARLAQVVGGSIAATPREGGGLEVSVTLPYAPEDIESDQEASSALKR